LLTTLAQIPTSIGSPQARPRTILRWQSNGTLQIELAQTVTQPLRWRWYQLDGRALTNPQSQNLSGASTLTIPAPAGSAMRVLLIENAGIPQTFVVPAQALSRE
jgi:hypothetical protein